MKQLGFSLKERRLSVIVLHVIKCNHCGMVV